MTPEAVGPLVYGPESCGDGDLIPGVFAPVNSQFGIQRCDLCELYPSDEEAAKALAAVIAPNGVVKQLDEDVENSREFPDLCIEVDGKPINLDERYREIYGLASL